MSVSSLPSGIQGSTLNNLQHYPVISGLDDCGHLSISQGKEGTEQGEEGSSIQGEDFELISVRDEHSQEAILNCNDEKSNQLMQISDVVPGTIMRKEDT